MARPEVPGLPEVRKLRRVSSHRHLIKGPLLGIWLRSRVTVPQNDCKVILGTGLSFFKWLMMAGDKKLDILGVLVQSK